MKITIQLLILLTALLFTACNFTIIGENDDEVVLEKRAITIVERNVTLEELSGTWVIEDESIERYLQLNTRYLDKKELIDLKKRLKMVYISLYKNNTVDFLSTSSKYKVHKGEVSIENLKEWEKTNRGYFLYISYKIEAWESKYLYFVKLNNKFYLGERFQRGEEETNSQKTYYLLYKKVDKKEPTHGKN